MRANVPTSPAQAVVAESRDGKAVLIGEAKWNVAELRASQAKDRLLCAAKNCPFVRGRKIVPVPWAQRGRKSPDIHILTPEAMLGGLR